MLKHVLSVAVFLTAGIVAYAHQTGFRIIGKVVADNSQEAVSMAIVGIEPGGKTAITGENGNFELLNIEPGRYLLTTTFVGYSIAKTEVEIIDADAEVLITLQWNGMLEVPVLLSKEVNVTSTRADRNTPVAFSEITKKEITALNNGQDMPYILRLTPSLVSTSDAGTGIGYTGLWIRGSDPSRINITINDIPINDPESQQVFWVNMPDLASSADGIQVQRGVGTSTNGAASFGGTIKIGTTDIKTKPYAAVNNTIGSFNTAKNTVMAGSGLMDNKYTVDVRLSSIKSDGYIDRASSDLKSFFTSAARYGNSSALKLTVFGGAERTYQSWYGTPISRILNDRDSMLTYASYNGLSDDETENLLNSGRTYNYYTYKNQVDDYRQTYYQLHYSKYFSHFNLNLAGHYTQGGGYYEEYKQGEEYARYGLSDLVLEQDTITSTNVIRRRWLKNHFYGTVGSVNYNQGNLKSTLGWAYNEYIGEHFGELLWLQFAGPVFPGDRYYQGNSKKTDGNLYFKNIYRIKNKLEVYTDLQIRNVNYKTNGLDNDLRPYDIHDNLVFFNPKGGITYNRRTNEKLYFSIACGNKEPNRNDYIDAQEGKSPKHETMYDLELGYQYVNNRFRFGINMYAMEYRNQLVLTGALNDVGAPVRTNVDDSYRRGVELEFGTNYKEKIFLDMNFTLSRNIIRSFEESVSDYSVDYSVQINKFDETPISFSPSAIGASSLEAILYGKKTEFGSRRVYLRLLSKYVGKQYLDNTGNEELMLDAYFVNDLMAGLDLQKSGGAELSLILGAQNVFNIMYSSNGYAYSYIYGSRISEVFHYPQAGRMWMLTLNLKLK